MKLSVRKFLVAVPLAIVSFEIYFGVLVGYIGAFFIAGKETGKPGKFKSLIVDLGSYRLHLHHWLLGLGCVPLAAHFNLSFLSDQFFVGMAGGLVYQGITCYSDWHKVIFRKR